MAETRAKHPEVPGCVVRLTDDAVEDLRSLFKADPQIVRWALKKMRTEHIRDVAWWNLDDVLAEKATFAPRRLPQLIDNLVRHGPPTEPVELDGF